MENINDINTFWSIVRRALPKVKAQVSIDIITWKEHFAKVLGQHTATAPEQDPVQTNDDDDIIALCDRYK